MKNILFFMETVDFGGAETVFTNIIKNINKSKFCIKVVTERDHELFTDEIKAAVPYDCFIKTERSAVRDFWNKIVIKLSLVLSEKNIRKYFIRGNYDVEVAFCEGYSTKIIGNSGKKNCKKIAWVHTDVIKNPWSEKIFGSAEEEKKCYEKFDAIVCVAETMKESFIKKYGMAEKVHVLYNPLDFESVIKKSAEKTDFKFGDEMKFVLAGTFIKIKGFDRFVKVCKRLKDDGEHFSALIMGDGEEKENIKKIIAETNLGDTVKILDFQTNPYKYIAHSDVYVCSSYAEGYSTAVSESVALNVPVITTECSGMREIFGKNECGIICENSEDGLYNAMKKVLNDPSLLKKFSAEEKKRANDFSLKKRMKAIEDFIESV
ncbi:MAG TPA: glycosyltransferase [Oscillospiraceae bacterium]|nr:glycosyltransferase [Oscillospiraceae bacterium]